MSILVVVAFFLMVMTPVGALVTLAAIVVIYNLGAMMRGVSLTRAAVSFCVKLAIRAATCLTEIMSHNVTTARQGNINQKLVKYLV